MCGTLKAQMKPVKPQPAVPTTSYVENQTALEVTQSLLKSIIPLTKYQACEEYSNKSIRGQRGQVHFPLS